MASVEPLWRSNRSPVWESLPSELKRLRGGTGENLPRIETVNCYLGNNICCGIEKLEQNRHFNDSAPVKNTIQDASKQRCNNTDNNETDMSNTDPFLSVPIIEKVKCKLKI